MGMIENTFKGIDNAFDKAANGVLKLVLSEAKYNEVVSKNNPEGPKEP